MTAPFRRPTLDARPTGAAAAGMGLLVAASLAHGQVRLSHHDAGVVISGTGVVCATGTIQTSADNRWYRAFTLSDFGVLDDLEIHTVEFGVEFVVLVTLPEADITISLYQIPADSPPIAPRSPDSEFLSSTTITLREPSLPSFEIVPVPISGVVGAGASLMVEVSAPDFRQLAGGEFGDFFQLGGAQPPAFPGFSVASDACGLSDPVGSDDLCAFGWPCDAIIMAEGRVVTACPADLDGDGELTLFDFLEFQRLFADGDARADFDGDGDLTLFDFLSFQSAFDAGCP
ncbi:MAG: GC-type dockerin domain-anchored protein [Planctomycetota bacterium]